MQPVAVAVTKLSYDSTQILFDYTILPVSYALSYWRHRIRNNLVPLMQINPSKTVGIREKM